PIVRARPFTHFGPRQPATFVIASFAQQIARIEAGKVPPILQVGNLQARRDFLPVEDVVAAYMVLAEQGTPGEAYNIGSGHARSIQSILDLLLTLTTASISVSQDPTRLRSVDIPLLEADISRIRAQTSWEPAVPFEVALQHTLEYWRMMVTTEEVAF
ncbi:MAG: GDP-mannose 4,6-dehydratase, partial [Ktedonobacteraceae bacterium]